MGPDAIRPRLTPHGSRRRDAVHCRQQRRHAWLLPGWYLRRCRDIPVVIPRREADNAAGPVRSGPRNASVGVLAVRALEARGPGHRMMQRGSAAGLAAPRSLFTSDTGLVFARADLPGASHGGSRCLVSKPFSETRRVGIQEPVSGAKMACLRDTVGTLRFVP